MSEEHKKRLEERRKKYEERRKELEAEIKRKKTEVFAGIDVGVFGVNLRRLLNSMLGIAGLTIDDLLHSPEEVRSKLESYREKLKEDSEKLRKILGDKLRIDYDIRIGGILGGKEVIRFSSMEESPLLKWIRRREYPTIKFTKEELEKAIEEAEKERKEAEEELRRLKESEKK